MCIVGAIEGGVGISKPKAFAKAAYTGGMEEFVVSWIEYEEDSESCWDEVRHSPGVGLYKHRCKKIVLWAIIEDEAM